MATDEDDLAEEDADYLRRLAAKAKAQSPFPITAAIKNPENGEEQDDLDFYGDDLDDDDEEGALDLYTTPLDDENCLVDEYVIFKETMQSNLKIRY